MSQEHEEMELVVDGKQRVSLSILDISTYAISNY